MDYEFSLTYYNYNTRDYWSLTAIDLGYGLEYIFSAQEDGDIREVNLGTYAYLSHALSVSLPSSELPDEVNEFWTKYLNQHIDYVRRMSK